MLRILCLLSAALACAAQTPLRVPWLAPAGPGRLASPLAAVPEQPLVAEDGGPGQVRIRFGADAEALHVQVRSDQPGLACRDRAYQNGDGLILVLASPEAGGAPARRFRVLGFSPQPEATRTWQFAFTWYRDMDLVMTPLAGAQCAWHPGPEGLTFSARIPWTVLAPYHPLLTPEVGLNACFVRAEGGGKRNFLLQADRHIQSELRPREYRPAGFEAPPAGLPLWQSLPAQGCLQAGEPIALRIAAAAAVELKVRLLEGEGSALATVRRTIPVPAGGPREIPVEGLRPPPGGYRLEVSGPGGTQVHGLTVLPAGGVAALQRRLTRLSGRILPGTESTLAFRLEDLHRALGRRAPADPAPLVRRGLEQCAADLQALEEGQDPVAAQRGMQRRAYRSAVDRTLQPYSLRVPERLEPGRRYPLLVFLHGSGQDDQGILEPRRAPEGWFELAPKGRGTSNCYSTDNAQDDLREAIADVLASQPVDPARIVLAGFSMGGYGVYRTGFERPGFFRAVAVFSGVPDLATRWLGPGHPDFLDPALLAPFKGLPMFVFHGTEDRNCPFAKTQAVVQGLQQAGAEVTFVVEPGKGHEAPSAATEERYFRWLEAVAAER